MPEALSRDEMPKLAKVIREAKIALAPRSTLHRNGQRVDTPRKSSTSLCSAARSHTPTTRTVVEICHEFPDGLEGKILYYGDQLRRDWHQQEPRWKKQLTIAKGG
jgi:hypothetical protein